jgi:molybdopterin-guanine dinucleotide biosynthesis protein A
MSVISFNPIGAISGLILAGGEGRRMSGRDKGLISLANKPLVEYAIDCLTPLVDDLAISCNRNQELYAEYGLNCVVDKITAADGGFAGPMAGLAAGLKQAQHDWLLVMPCDTPLMSGQIMTQLLTALIHGSDRLDTTGAQARAVIFSHQGLQPLHGLYHKSMLPIFEQSLAEKKNALQRLLRSIDNIKIIEAQECNFNFNNANDAEELSIIEKLLARH